MLPPGGMWQWKVWDTQKTESERPSVLRKWNTPGSGEQRPTPCREVLYKPGHYAQTWGGSSSGSSLVSRDSGDSSEKVRMCTCARMCSCPIRFTVAIIVILLMAVAVGAATYYLMKTSIKDKQVLYEALYGEVKLTDWQYTPSLADGASDDFRVTQLRFCNTIENIVLEGPTKDNFYACSVNSFSKGSLVVNFTMLFESDSPRDTIADTAGILVKAIKEGKLGMPSDLSAAKFSVEPSRFVNIQRTVIEQKVEYRGVVSLSKDVYIDALASRTSDEFKVKADTFCDNLISILSDSSLANQDLSCQVLRFSPGSVNIEYALTVILLPGQNTEDIQDEINVMLPAIFNTTRNNEGEEELPTIEQSDAIKYFQLHGAKVIKESLKTNVTQIVKIVSEEVKADALTSCDTLNGGCSHTCSMTNGDVICSCPINVQLGQDGRTCQGSPAIELPLTMSHDSVTQRLEVNTEDVAESPAHVRSVSSRTDPTSLPNNSSKTSPKAEITTPVTVVTSHPCTYKPCGDGFCLSTRDEAGFICLCRDGSIQSSCPTGSTTSTTWRPRTPDPCSSNPCASEGQCFPLMEIPGYACLCDDGTVRSSCPTGTTDVPTVYTEMPIPTGDICGRIARPYPMGLSPPNWHLCYIHLPQDSVHAHRLCQDLIRNVHNPVTGTEYNSYFDLMSAGGNFGCMAGRQGLASRVENACRDYYLHRNNLQTSCPDCDIFAVCIRFPTMELTMELTTEAQSLGDECGKIARPDPRGRGLPSWHLCYIQLPQNIAHAHRLCQDLIRNVHHPITGTEYNSYIDLMSAGGNFGCLGGRQGLDSGIENACRDNYLHRNSLHTSCPDCDIFGVCIRFPNIQTDLPRLPVTVEQTLDYVNRSTNLPTTPMPRDGSACGSMARPHPFRLGPGQYWELCYITLPEDLTLANTTCQDLVRNVRSPLTGQVFPDHTSLLAADGNFGCWRGRDGLDSLVEGGCRPLYQHTRSLDGCRVCNIMSLCLHFPPAANSTVTPLYPTDPENLALGSPRLVGGASPRQGRVEIYLGAGQWGTVCDDSWELDDAHVVCNMFGYSHALYPWSHSQFGGGHGKTILLDDIECTRPVNTILECGNRGFYVHNCDHDEDAGVTCSTEELDPGSTRIRLIGGRAVNEGRVEVQMGGVWGTVCDDSWDIDDANVVCRMLGFPRAMAATKFASFGSGSGPIVMDEVDCQGGETSLQQCPHFNISDCVHNEDAGVICDWVEESIQSRFMATDKPTSSTRRTTIAPLVTTLLTTIAPPAGPCVSHRLTLPQCTRATPWQNTFLEPTHQRILQQALSHHTSDFSRLFNNTCYTRARDFLCAYFVGPCHEGQPLRPCKSFCESFVSGCGHILPADFAVTMAACEYLPDYPSNPIKCISSGNYFTISSNSSASSDADRFATSTFDPCDMQPCGSSGTCKTGASGYSCDCSNGDKDKANCPGGKCEAMDLPGENVTSSIIDYVGYNTTQLPGLNDTATQLEALNATIFHLRHITNITFSDITNLPRYYNCVQNVYQFLLSMYLPKCDAAGRKILPCQQLCLDYVQGCSGMLNTDPFFPDDSSCQSLVNSADDNDCLRGRDRCLGVMCEPGATCVPIPTEVGAQFSCMCSDGSFNCKGTTDVPTSHTEMPIPTAHVRLVDGISSASGRVEIFHDGHWGTICDDSFGHVEAQVVCRMLGYSNGYHDTSVPVGSGRIWLDNVECTGLENEISECNHNGWGNHNCGHNEDIGVRCIDVTAESRVRLVDGLSSASGRVEIYHDGRWGTICDDLFGHDEARVICRMLGYSDGNYDTSVPAGSGRIWLDNVACTGFENDITECNHNPWGNHDCGHNEDVGVRCFGNTTGSTAYPPVATTPMLITNVSQYAIRLANGPSANEGQVEIFYKGQWGTVCDDNFGREDAQVVCRSLGYSGGSPFCCGRYGSDPSPIWLDNVNCRGNETGLQQCQHPGWGTHDCSNGEDVSVRCTDLSEQGDSIRLVNGNVPWKGRVEIFHNNRWGTVCDDLWSDDDARVVCRQLGYRLGQALSNSAFGRGTGPTWLDNVLCHGDETFLSHCQHNGWGNEDCGHHEDASVICFPGDNDVVSNLTCGFTESDDTCFFASNNYSDLHTWAIVEDEFLDSKVYHLNFTNPAFNSQASIQSPGVESEGELCIKFLWRLMGVTSSLIHVDVSWYNNATSPTMVTRRLVSLTRRIADVWQQTRVTVPYLNDTSAIRVTLVFQTAGNNTFSIDDFNVTQGSCAVPECDAGEVQCSSGDQCIPEEALCDNEYDCQDASDEFILRDCSNVTLVSCTFEEESYSEQCAQLTRNDWRLTSGANHSALILADNTLSTENGTYLLSNYLVDRDSRMDLTPLRAHTGSAEKFCLSFYYIHNSSLRVETVGSDGISRTRSPLRRSLHWTFVQLFLDDPRSILLFANGTTAIDDVFLRAGACPPLAFSVSHDSSPDGGSVVTVKRAGVAGLLCTQGSGHMFKVTPEMYNLARVVCRTVGLPHRLGVPIPQESLDMPVWLHDVWCRGDEEHLRDCRYRAAHSLGCEQENDNFVRVDCVTDAIKFRLVGGFSRNSGRLEIYHNNTWSPTLQTPGWDTHSASVVCRQLGLEEKGKIIPARHAHMSTNQTWQYFKEADLAASFSCNGSERHLLECTISTYPTQMLRHKEGPVWIQCGATEKALRPGECDFESDLSGYTQSAQDDRDWTRHNSTPSQGTGPDSDHTPGGRYFMYLEASSPGSPGDRAVLTSPEFSLQEGQCVIFYYLLHGKAITADSLTVRLLQAGITTDLWTGTTTPSPVWQRLVIPNLPKGPIQLQFQAKRGLNHLSDVAIDDIRITQCPQPEDACLEGEFQCGNTTQCIRSDFVCNNLADCLDNSDEIECECKPNEFKCGDGTCIPSEYACDAIGGCGDFSDETSCSRLNCTPGFFRCWSGPCISQYKRCDGLPSCPQGDISDEVDCPLLQVYPSDYALRLVGGKSSNEGRLEIAFNGTWGSICRRSLYNIYYHNTTASSICQMMGFNKSGTVRSDVTLPGSGPIWWALPTCQGNETHISQCTKSALPTNGTFCQHRWDMVLTCSTSQDNTTACNEFSCGAADNHLCLGFQDVCDGIRDCTISGLDEVNCTACDNGSISCDNGACIPGANFCDGFDNCGSDEPPGCTCIDEFHFTCGDGRCISKDKLCNELFDCADKSDEKWGCECSANKSRCSDGLCLGKELFCDGLVDCDDASDEPMGCSCNEYQFSCDGRCFSRNKLCDGFLDCTNGFDEDPSSCQCDSNEQRCDNSRCVNSGYWCDGDNDCGDFSDELGCGSCTFFYCTNGHQVCSRDICDHEDDCGDESDEAGCACRNDEFECNNGKCIQREWMCDSQRDCGQGEDETNCTVCAQGGFTCDDHTCVPGRGQCDGVWDCKDGSDERHCVIPGSPHVTLNGTVFSLAEAYDYRSEDYIPVCSTGWNEAHSQTFCMEQSLGVSKGFIEVERRPTKTFVLTSSNHGRLMANLRLGPCPQGKIVAVKCEEQVCGQPSARFPSAFVVGGDLAPKGRWPWQVQVFSGGRLGCGGTLITGHWVLTAGHCVDGSDPIQVRAGTTKAWDPDVNAHRSAAQAIYIHENFAGHFDHYINDIALVRLEQTLPLTDLVRPACLPTGPDILALRNRCWVTGWGHTMTGGGIVVEDLREAKLNLMPHEQCDALHKGMVEEDLMICAGYASGHITACHGDSGGPLVCKDYNDRWQIVGVTNWGNPECRTEPSVFANVFHYKDWIMKTMLENP